MKPIFQKFSCTECGEVSILKSKNICINCRDKRILNEIIQEKTIEIKNQ